MPFGAKYALTLASLVIGALYLQSQVLAGEREKIVITGASTLAPLVADIARRYESSRPGIQVDVQTGGSARGVSDLRRDLSDIGLVSRDLAPSERDLNAVTLAYDGVAMLVHSSNPVSKLSNDEIRAIYTGKITDWSAVGGHEGRITVVTKADGRSTLEVFLTNLDLRADQIKADIVIGDNEQAVKIVEGNPAAIAYVSIGTIEYNMSIATPVKAIAIGPVEATSNNVRNGSYAVRRPLNFVIRPTHTQAVDDFLKFATGEDNRDVITGYFFVPAAQF